MRGWLRGLLAVSLLLNALLLGFGGAIAWKLRHGAVGLAETAMIRPLGPADKALMRAAFAAAEPQARAAQARMRAAHLAVDDALRADPYDPAALQRALDGWRVAIDAYLGSFEPAVAQGASEISPAGRRAMADHGDAQVSRAEHAYFGP